MNSITNNSTNHVLALTTIEFANSFRVASQTVRKNLCLNGHCYGIKPLKVGNKLLWPANEVAMKLPGGAI